MTYHAFHTHGDARSSRWLITCDHATNTVPPRINGGTLGLPQSEMARHIAYDPGAAGVAHAMADALQATLITSNFSRLVIDPNRGEDDPTLLMKLYDGTIIPGNRHAGPEELEYRKELCYRPYHAELGRLAASRRNPVIVAVHSFTPQLKGRPPRPWHVALLHTPPNNALSLAMIRRLKAEGDLCVGDNEPYAGHQPGDSIHRHALMHGRPHVLIEVRQDLIETVEQQRAWGRRMAPHLVAALEDANL
ncbi:putative N-formylglutamate amidohydrolase [Aliiruegeria haliotis]|uniref:Putative N-formylglutamate amidohydrolase n=1 Tax=Aliiruegeria haliotis TaxID=1280846 RepID=A0A2T0RKR2_9RHOB|nr:N-formylglutamate amidohydrolase [Aliiruegeria haliotis]PRY21758.1 putative N-formylglutamate amidohydrolase [Aliiruegeria haliotis]